jgi:hypothetical protein
MASLWEDVKNAIVDGYVYASDKAEEMTQIGRARVEIMKLNRQIARTMADIGGRVYELFDHGSEAEAGNDEDIRDAVDRIRGYRAEIRKWEKEIDKAKSEHRENEREESEEKETTP